MDQALATAPMRWRVLRSTNTGYNHAGSLRGFKATASSCGNSQTAHATHSTPSPPHSRQDHETPTSPQTPDNKLHHRHAKIFKSPLAGFLLVAPRSRLASASPRTPRRHLAAFARGPAIRDGTCSLGPTGQLDQPRTLRCQPTTLGQRLTNGLWGPL